MIWNPVRAIRNQFELRARAREYDAVMKTAALLGHDAGDEMYILAHEDDPIPHAPDGSMWMRWEADAPEALRNTALLFNAQMSYAIGRAEGYAEAFQIDVFDKTHRALRNASEAS